MIFQMFLLKVVVIQFRNRNGMKMNMLMEHSIISNLIQYHLIPVFSSCFHLPSFLASERLKNYILNIRPAIINNNNSSVFSNKHPTYYFSSFPWNHTWFKHNSALHLSPTNHAFTTISYLEQTPASSSTNLQSQPLLPNSLLSYSIDKQSYEERTSSVLSIHPIYQHSPEHPTFILKNSVYFFPVFANA